MCLKKSLKWSDRSPLDRSFALFNIFLFCCFPVLTICKKYSVLSSTTSLVHGNLLFLSWCEHLVFASFPHYKTAFYVVNNGSTVPLLFPFQSEMCGNPPCLSQKAWLSSVNHSYPVTPGAGRSGSCVVPCADLDFLRLHQPFTFFW